jgi:ribosomal protein S18 acetylase RimI-like enzyme
MNINSISPNLQYRILTQADWQEFKKFRLFSLQESPEVFGVSYEEALTSNDTFWQNNLANGCFLAFFDSNTIPGSIVATLNLTFNTKSKFQHIAKLSNVYTLPDYRRKGLLSLLLNQAEIVAKEKKVEILQLDVLLLNESAAKAYHKFGFNQVAIIPKAVKNKNEYYDEIIMQKEIQ